jgi:ketol-acid reductoisomerase
MKNLSNFKLSFLQNKIVVMIGFGSQGSAWALNLKDSGFNIKIALQDGSKSKQKVLDAGFEVLSLEEGIKTADVVMMLIPDENHGEFFTQYIKPNLKKGAAIIVAHGFSFHFNFVNDYKNYNIGMIAPKAVGKAVRSHFIEKKPLFSLTAKFWEVDNNLTSILDEIAMGIGSKMVLETTFKEECESDLFGEQAVLCGGVVSLFKNAFDVMVEEGFSPFVAYYECIHELKLIVDLIYEKGVNDMFSSISNTAKFGGLKTGDFLINEDVKTKMKEVLTNIQNGSFAKSFMNEALIKNYQFKKEIEQKYKTSKLNKAGKEVINLFKSNN